MRNTTNLNLNLPDYDNVADIEIMNANSEIIDKLFDGKHVVMSVNGNKPVAGDATVDVGVTTVNGQKGDVVVRERSVKDLIDIIYPVGSYYDTSDRTFDPNVIWSGTTWEKIVDGRVLIAGGGTYNIGTNYGELTHKLTIAELPSHNHTANVSENGSHKHNFGHPLDEFGFDVTGGGEGPRQRGAKGDNYPYNNSITKTYDVMQTAGNHKHTVTIGNTGSNVAFNLVQPSTAVARWHRTA